jgi:hypothetical protein
LGLVCSINETQIEIDSLRYRTLIQQRGGTIGASLIPISDKGADYEMVCGLTARRPFCGIKIQIKKQLAQIC